MRSKSPKSFASDKHSSLFIGSVSKKVYNIGTRRVAEFPKVPENVVDIKICISKVFLPCVAFFNVRLSVAMAHR